MNPLKTLYVHHVNVGHDIPKNQREEVTAVLDSYYSAVEYQGFVAGFKTAIELCRRCYGE